ncbi:PepSY-associated TM helix domain-containing protein [Alienimonas sp. DA493]|uniref:PepSY-associated TM helix domain-containing protein n=1 Tax=Alienimonas sp. DA493 TaxID=3373605 RepID=UPI0037546F45
MTPDQDGIAEPERRLKPRARQLWLAAHRWLGLSVGLLFVLLGLTGSLLVFDHAIDEWLNPDLLLSQAEGADRSIEEVVAAAEDAHPGNAPAGAVTAPRIETGVWTVWFVGGDEKEPEFTAVHVDRRSGEVTGQRVWGEYLMTWVYRLHFQLFAGEFGGALVGVAGVFVIASLLSGIYLWWPLWKNGWRAAFAVRRGRRLIYDLHKSVGIFSAALLLAITFTGVYLEFPNVFHGAASWISKTTESPSDLRSAAPRAGASISPDEALEIAARRFPNARFDHLHPPEGDAGVYEVAFRQPDEVQRSFGRTQVYVDRYTGEVVAVRAPEDFTAADAFFAWQFPLHNGEAFGLVGRWVVFFVGLTPAGLYVTGFLLWRRKRLSKRRRRRRRVPNAGADSAAAGPPFPSDGSLRAEPNVAPR